MYLYFFDIDDTICDTRTLIEQFISDIDISNVAKNEIDKLLKEKFVEYGVDKIPTLDNSTHNLLKHLLKKSPEKVYYLTARDGSDREFTTKWLKTNNLWIEDKKLIMDSDGIKGKIMNEILEKDPHHDFAIFFDDMYSNHEEVAKYKNIVSVLPETCNIKNNCIY